MRLRRYILRRVISAFIVFLIILTLNFIIFHTIPGDPIRTLFQDPRITLEDRQRMSHIFGLDKSLFDQYTLYMYNTFRGEMGLSFVYRDSVSGLVGDRLVNTLVLVGSASLLAMVIGVLGGILSAWKRNSPTDYGVLGTSLFVYSVPTFWLGMLMLFSLAGRVPSAGMFTPGAYYGNIFDQFIDLIRHLMVPMIVLTLVLIGQYVMLMRASLIDVLSEDYVTTAKAKGLTNWSVLRRHAIPNAMLPLVTVIAINMSLVLGGAIQTETVFSWPGIGRLMYDSLVARDYPMLQGCFLVLTIVALIANVLADIAYAYLDPRVKVG
jgi:peptide/nickel transport system permease protein